MKLPRLPFAAIVPTPRAAVLLALAAPLALLIAALAPGAWIVAPALGGALLLLIVLDALLAGKATSLDLTVPGNVEVGAETGIETRAQFAGKTPSSADLALAVSDRLVEGGRAVTTLSGDVSNSLHATLALRPNRRGTGTVSAAWLRWVGPLGLGARQKVFALDRPIRVWPNIAAVRSPALQTFLRDSQFGMIARRIRGEGTQFEALTDYEPGMDRRRIDWKSSARHIHLYAKEFDTERNNQIVFAFDCGRAMCEPVEGMPRIDRAVSAALATAYVALRGGDKVALYGFAARPEVLTPFVSDSRDFRRLQEAAASLDYHAEEPNFTLALASLASKLQRRSLIVIFSDFTDPTSAELLIESVHRLVSKHLVLFVTLADSELEEIAREEPGEIETVAMAVTADSLLRQRALAVRRLRQVGADVIEAPHETIGTRLIDAYLAIKRTGAIG